MALLMFDGFELAPNLRNGATVSGALATTGRDGVGKAVTWNVGSTSMIFPITPTNLGTLIMGLGWKFTSGSFGTTTAGSGISIMGDAGATAHLTINLASDGRLLLRRGAANGTILQTSSLIPTPGWVYLEVKATIADAGGICIIKVNGAEFINFTGDTKNAGTLNSVSGLVLGGFNANPNMAYDDLVICDGTGSAPWNDFFGEKLVRLKGPTGNGATNQWVGSDGNSTDNYQLVDEIPVSATDYVGSLTAGERDLYALGSVSLGSVDAIQNVAYVAKTDAGARSFKTVTRDSSGNITTSSTVALGTTFALLQGGVEQTNPAGAAWTFSNVNDIQAGVETV